MLEVILYTRESCSPCKTLKHLFAKNNIVYKEFPLEVSEFRSAPTTIIGEHVVFGPNFTRIRELLGI